MKRLLPILLVLLVLIALLVSCGPEDVPTTTFEEPITEEPETTTRATYTTTKKKLGMGIDAADEGWSFWGDF
jgi:ABC-type uncharacterized transport system auxiliary subunit